MLFHLDITLDASIYTPEGEEALAQEHLRAAELREEGIAVALWRKASGRGAIAVWDCASHDQLRETLRSMPLRVAMSRIEVTPLVTHPLFETD